MPYLIPMIIHTLNIIFALHNQIQANTCTSLYEKNNTNTLNAGCCCAFPPLFLSFPAAECMFVFSQRKLVRQQNQDVPKHFISLGLWQIVKDYITTCQYKFATKKPLHSIIYFFFNEKENANTLFCKSKHYMSDVEVLGKETTNIPFSRNKPNQTTQEMLTYRIARS